MTPGKMTVQAAVRGDRCCIVVDDDVDDGKPGTSGTGFGLRASTSAAAAVRKRSSVAISRNNGYRFDIELPASE